MPAEHIIPAAASTYRSVLVLDVECSTQSSFAACNLFYNVSGAAAASPTIAYMDIGWLHN